IWDVLEAADRTGSLDGRITKPVPNDIPSFLRDRPAIGSVFFNGAKAEQLFLERVEPMLATAMRRDISFVRLPSTSPANARLPFTQKLAAWRRVRDEAAVD
ncbi:MAG TPA: DNA-deoxyinosine glycosylase, partial [Thermoleophilia bacterium]|nr:DNA-deoxyinosine glycosylase [Thermoleophilia bacterium]